MSAYADNCPVCGAEKHYTTADGEALFYCGSRSRTVNCPNAERLAIERAKRITHLEAALTRIKSLADAPDPDPSGDRQLGLHCGLEDRGAQGDPYVAVDYGYSEGVSRTMEWAVQEAEAGLKGTP